MTRSVAIGLLALIPAAAPAQQSYPLSGNTVAVYNLVGEVTVRGGAGSDVTVEVTRQGRDAGQLRVETREIQGRQALQVVYPGDRIVYGALSRHSSTQFSIREDGTWGDFGRDSHRGGRRGRQVTIRSDGDGVEASADLRITVPRGKRLELALGVGRVELSNVDGEMAIDAASAPITARATKGGLWLDTGSGEIRVEDAEGEVELDTGSGDVRLVRVRGDMHIDTGSGSVTGSGLEGTSLNIDTGSGDIDVTGVTATRIRLDTGSGSVDATLVNSPVDAEIDTGSGSVTLRLPETTSATVDLESGSGDFTVSFPLTLLRKDDSSLRGRIGDGRGRIAIDTGSGDISLLK